jgi:hypothetical protein
MKFRDIVISLGTTKLVDLNLGLDSGYHETVHRNTPPALTQVLESC